MYSDKQITSEYFSKYRYYNIMNAFESVMQCIFDALNELINVDDSHMLNKFIKNY